MSGKSQIRRLLRFENLQKRELMAADLEAHSSAPESLNDAGAEFATYVAGSAQSSGNTISANARDAGSTRATASQLGVIEESKSISGGLSYRDTMDVFRFELRADGEVDLSLSGLRRDADLFLTDANGMLIARNPAAGAASEQLHQSLDAGVYYVGIQSRAFWGTGYRLEISANLAAPAEPSQPLVDVDYFGGTRDWNLNAVGAPEAWAAGYTGEGVLVAVVDTGVDLDHPDLVESLYVNPGEIAGDGIDNDGNGYVDDVHGYDFAGRDANANDANANDVNGHGTHVAGSIAASSNGFGATGVAPDAKILPVRVLGDNGSGSSNAVAAGIRYAADMGANIINLSLGGSYSRAIDAAIDYAQSLGSLIIAAAGNESASVPGYPAAFSAFNENVLSVGAHDSRGRIAGFSNDVGNSGSVQIDAPGVGVFSTYAGGRFGSLSGTSMAAPQVAGVAALALSAAPELTAEQLRDLLIGGVTQTAVGSDAIGVVNAATTVAYAAAGLTASPVAAASTLAGTSQIRGVIYRTTSFGGIAIVRPSDRSTRNEDSRHDLILHPETLSVTAKIASNGNVDPIFGNKMRQQDETLRDETPRDEALVAESNWADPSWLDELHS